MLALTQYISSRSWRSAKWHLSGNLNSFSFREGTRMARKGKDCSRFWKKLARLWLAITIQIQMSFFVFRTMRDYTVLDVGPNRYDGASAIYFESLVVVCKITYIWKPRVFRSKKECGWQGREKIGADCVKNCARLCSVIAPFRFKCISSSRFVGKKYMRFEKSALQQAAAKKWWAANVS